MITSYLTDFFRAKINHIGSRLASCTDCYRHPQGNEMFEATGRLISAELEAVTSKESQTTKASENVQ